ncbi:hypothetical protein Bhyg_00502 [Pseudolycoriella hygida]|uniref:Uncharacterized protein n=1 Tax=Pseudolycoriella hygida TaxID=35572 RepID=A0A9Q0N869_9DIPT|nr:hypothetical protein Bhyg_00502 [Pseudolycoriella hygida]
MPFYFASLVKKLLILNAMTRVTVTSEEYKKLQQQTAGVYFIYFCEYFFSFTSHQTDVITSCDFCELQSLCEFKNKFTNTDSVLFVTSIEGCEIAVMIY